MAGGGGAPISFWENSWHYGFCATELAAGLVVWATTMITTAEARGRCCEVAGNGDDGQRVCAHASATCAAALWRGDQTAIGIVCCKCYQLWER